MFLCEVLRKQNSNVPCFSAEYLISGRPMVEMAGIKFALSALNFDVLVCFLFHFVKSGKRFTPNFCSLLPGTGVNYYSGT